MDVRPLLERLATIKRLGEELNGWIAGLHEVMAFAPEPAVAPTSAFIDGVAELPAGAKMVIEDLVPVLSNRRARECLEALGRRLAQYRRLAEKILDLLGELPSWTLDEIDQIRAAAELVATEVSHVSTVIGAETAETNIREASRGIAGGPTAAGELARWLEHPLKLTPSTLALLRNALDLVPTAPIDSLHLRHPGLADDGTATILQEAIKTAEVLHAARSDLARRFHINLVPALDDLRQHALAAANAQWWSILDTRYRAAKRVFRAMLRGSVRFTRQSMKDDFQRLLAFAQDVRKFGMNSAFQAAAGNSFQGIDTDFRGLLKLAEWRASIWRKLKTSGKIGESLATALWRLPSDQLRALHDDESAVQEMGEALASAEQGLDTARESLRPEHRPREADALSAYAEKLESLASELSAAATLLRRAGIPELLPLSSVLELLDHVVELRKLAEEVTHDDAREVLGDHFRGVHTEFEAIEQTIGFFDRLMRSPVPEPVKTWLTAEDTVRRLRDLRQRCEWARERLATFLDEASRFSAAAGVDEAEWFAGVESTQRDRFAIAVARADRGLNSRDALPGWLEYVHARNRAAKAKLQLIVDLAERGTIEPGDLHLAFDFVVANSLVREIFKDHPDLAQFSALTHEQIREGFANLDKEIVELTRARIAAILDRRRIPAGVSTGPIRNYTELSLIDREISKQRKHIPIRQLVHRAGSALQALKPCFMMGPLSVAQYLPPGGLEFDLVVMDEASQLKPEDALGAICRGKQVVIVGDPMQLPPTSFFDRIGDDDALDDADAHPIDDAESILDVAHHLYKPTRMLRWHYRSRHGSLIAFSNKEFYDRQLVVFPSPLAKAPDYGIKFVQVPDGVYENRRNVIEARRVVDAAFKHMRHRPDESLGIVALNTAQRDVIENEVEQRSKIDPHAQRFMEKREHSLEPLFIKNLENVQGDERDVIFVSVTYGPNENGRVYQRFGPINSATGHRRLNVLFTRARKRLAVFSSMLSEQIIADPASSAWGVRALKAYLAYAQTGILEQALSTGRDPDSDFEVDVAEAIQSCGYAVVAQVGVAGYFIDLAVKHPRKPDAFVLGVECDGAMYHSSRSARDRDRLRQAVLEDLGWRIVRVWSTDWFKNRQAQVGRIIRRIEEILEEEAETGVEEMVAPVPTESDDQVATQRQAQKRLSSNDAREQLVALRERVIKSQFPSMSMSSCILRDEMIEALLRLKPRDHSEWIARVPFDLRIDTDVQQMEFLDEILDIVGRVMN